MLVASVMTCRLFDLAFLVLHGRNVGLLLLVPLEVGARRRCISNNGVHQGNVNNGREFWGANRPSMNECRQLLRAYDSILQIPGTSFLAGFVTEMTLNNEAVWQNGMGKSHQDRFSRRPYDLPAR